MNSKMSEAARFRRECVDRSYSERQIDRILLKDQMKKNQNARQDISEHEARLLKKIRKENQLIKNVVREAAPHHEEASSHEEGSSTSHHIEEASRAPAEEVVRTQNASSSSSENEVQQAQQIPPENKNQVTENPQPTQPHEILEKGLKNLASKPSKTVEWLQRMLTNFLPQLRSEHVMETLYQLQHRRKTYKKQTLILVHQIFKFVQANSDQLLRRQQQNAQLFRIFSLWGLHCCGLLSDDTFQFNRHVKDLQQALEELVANKQNIEVNDAPAQLDQQNTEQEKPSLLSTIREKLNKNNIQQQQKSGTAKASGPDYVFEHSKGFKQLVASPEKKNELTRDLVLEALEQMCNSAQLYSWARPQVKLTMSEIYYNKKACLFAENDSEAHQKMDELFAGLQKMTNAENTLAQKREQLDRAIMGNPLHSKNTVVDGRTETIDFSGGLDKWGMNQMGFK